MNPRRALIFDVDGTLADTESAHRAAFNLAFEEEKLGWVWGEALYTRLLRVSGGHERLAAYWREALPMPVDEALLARVHATKTRIYTAEVLAGNVPLRPGVRALVEDARARNVPLAIATTTTAANVDALLRLPLGPDWRKLFAFVGDASTASRKKPDPEVYEQALSALGKNPWECLAFEDSENGLAAARSAGIPTVITPTSFTANDDFSGALSVLPDLSAVSLGALLAMRAVA
jgi:HAD superfamily hydrolase (TIGR01509 family)